MLLGARTAMWGGKRLPYVSAKEYIINGVSEDGLVAMWDGIENAGWGVHTSDTSLAGVDLSGNGYNLEVNSLCTLTADAITSDDIWMAKGSQISYSQFAYVECVCSLDSGMVFIDGNTPESGAAKRFLYCPDSNNVRTLSSSSRVFGLSEPTTKVKNIAVMYSSNSVYLNGEIITDITTSSAVNPIGNTEFVVGAAGIYNGTYGRRARNFKMHNLRIFSRMPTEAETAHRLLIDRRRFNFI